MKRVLRRLQFETHPIFNALCCAFEHQGDVVHVKEDEVHDIARAALSHVVDADLRRFDHLPDIRLDLICRDRLAAAASAHHFRSLST